MAFTLDSMLNPFKDTPGFNKSLFLGMYHQKYLQIKEKIQWGCCRNGDNYVVHVRIPSEDSLCPDVYYDIVFEFFAESDKVRESRSIVDYSVLVFSNCPSFTFTFTYAYNKFGLLIDWMKDKCIPRCMSDPAVMRNPHSMLRSDMKTWYAAYHLQQIGLLNYKKRFDTMINTSVNSIHKNVMHQLSMLMYRNKIHDREKLKIQNNRAAQKANQRFSEYRERKDYQHAIERSSLNGKVNAADLSKRLAKSAKQSRAARSARSPRRAKSHR